MASTTKSKLKDIQKCIKSEDFERAIELSKEVVKEEKGKEGGQNVYNALVFAGLSYSKLPSPRPLDSEKVYLQAIKLLPDLPLAYQGLTKLYTEGEEWEKLCGLLEGGVGRGWESGDAVETAKNLQRLIEVRQQQEMTHELHRLLDLLLPSSPLYSLLLSLDPPTPNTYIPFPLPALPHPPSIHTLPLSSPPPSSSLSFNPPPPIPNPLPPIAQLMHNQENGLALLLGQALRREGEEREGEEREVGVRRKRLGAGGETQVRRGVSREVLSGSRMPAYYEEILAHPAASDEVRRAAESRLLRHWYRLMAVTSRNAPEPTTSPNENDEHSNTDLTPSEKLFNRSPAPAQPALTKEELRGKVQEMVDGMVLLKVEDEGAWMIRLEWGDLRRLDEYPLPFLHEYSLLFPSSPYTSLIIGYLRYFGRPGPNDETAEELRRKRRERRRVGRGKKEGKGKKVGEGEKNEEEDGEVEGKAEEKENEDNKRKEPFTIIVNGMEACPKSLFAHKVLSEVYLAEGDYANTISTAEKGLSLIKAVDVETGLKLSGSKALLDSNLATALVHYFPPKHHPRALSLLDGVLASDPDSVTCLMGKGYIYAWENKWAEARAEFERVVSLEEGRRGPGEKDTQPVQSAIEVEAVEQSGWCLVKEGQFEAGKGLLREVAEVFDADESKAEGSARVWWRIGTADWERGDEYRQDAHEAFVTALRFQPNYAPAFTSIGIWYLEYANPPDEDRASKCFQKAFELDATQAEAARRLAVGYANEGEWGLVNVIAKRVMEGEGGIEGGLQAAENAAAKFLPTNAWAWKASGAVQMVYKKYNLAAQAFQVALRADPTDAAILTRLGEAYAKSGRHVASLKALHQALEINPDSWLCYYHIGTVQRDLGLLAQAIEAFNKALELQPENEGVSLALSATWLSLGTAESTSGLKARAFRSCTQALHSISSVFGEVLSRHTALKLFADTCMALASCARDETDMADSFKVVKPFLEELQAGDSVADVSGVVVLADLLSASTFELEDLLRAAITGYKARSVNLAGDSKIGELPLYDLALALHTLAGKLSVNGSNAGDASRKEAVLNIKRALEIDSSSPTLWNAFAVIAAPVSPELAQHAYVAALALAPKDHETWCNFGFLCFDNGDLDLATAAFSKAQIIEAESARAWLGQGLVAHKRGDLADAQALFEQASTLSSNSLLLAGLGFASLLFQPYLTSAAPSDTSALHQPSFALSQYCDANPDDAAAAVLHAAVLEQLGLHDPAIERVTSAVTVLESRYEAAEIVEVEQQYAMALVNLARLQLHAGRFDDAETHANDCLGLCSEREDDQGIILVTECHLVLAMTAWNKEDVDQSIERFEQSLTVVDKLQNAARKIAIKSRLSVLLARSLWAFEVEDARVAAKTQLLDAFAADARSIDIMATLLAIGAVSDDKDIVDGVIEELKGFNEEDRSVKDPRGQLAVLKAYYSLSQGNVIRAKQALSRAVHVNPAVASTRNDLASILLATSSTEGIDGVILRPGSGKGDVHDDAAGLSYRGLAQAMEGDEQGTRKLFKAVALEPWEAEHWQRAVIASV